MIFVIKVLFFYINIKVQFKNKNIFNKGLLTKVVSINSNYHFFKYKTILFLNSVLGYIKFKFFFALS